MPNLVLLKYDAKPPKWLSEKLIELSEINWPKCRII